MSSALQSLILSRSDPAETQSLIWRMSGWEYYTARLWQWRWYLNADSGSTNLTPNAAYKAEKYENSGRTERILLYLWQPFSRFVVCSLVQVSMDHAWINEIKCKDLGVGCDVGATGETYSFKTRSRTDPGTVAFLNCNAFKRSPPTRDLPGSSMCKDLYHALQEYETLRIELLACLIAASNVDVDPM